VSATGVAAVEDDEERDEGNRTQNDWHEELPMCLPTLTATSRQQIIFIIIIIIISIDHYHYLDDHNPNMSQWCQNAFINKKTCQSHINDKLKINAD